MRSLAVGARRRERQFVADLSDARLEPEHVLGDLCVVFRWSAAAEDNGAVTLLGELHIAQVRVADGEFLHPRLRGGDDGFKFRLRILERHLLAWTNGRLLLRLTAAPLLSPVEDVLQIRVELAVATALTG